MNNSMYTTKTPELERLPVEEKIVEILTDEEYYDPVLFEEWKIQRDWDEFCVYELTDEEMLQFAEEMEAAQ